MEARNAIGAEAGEALNRGFAFIEEAFGDGQEMVLFVTELSKNECTMEYIGNHGCEPYFRYSDRLLYRKRQEELQKDCEELSAE